VETVHRELAGGATGTIWEIQEVIKMATKRQLLKLIRLNCSECMGGPRASKGRWPISNIANVDGCTASECGFYPYRFASDPAPPSEGRRLSGQRLGKLMQAHTAMTKQAQGTKI
jgi:hypothetical protein